MNIQVHSHPGYGFQRKAVKLSEEKATQRAGAKIKWPRALFLIIAFGAGFSGFQMLLIGIHAAGLGFDSRMFTVPYRAGFLGFSILFLWYLIAKKRLAPLGLLWIPLFTFWSLYFLRIAMDGFIFLVPLGQPPIEYVQKAVGMTFIPMLIFLTRLTPADNKIAFRAFWLVHLSCLVLSLFFYGRFIATGYRAIRYMGYDTAELLSPVSISYMGAMTVVIGIQRIVTVSSIRNKWQFSAVMLFILMLGAFALVYGGTRSIILGSAILCFIVFFLSFDKKIPMFNLVKGVIFTSLFAGILLWLSVFAGSEMISRFNILIDQWQYNPLTVAGGRLQMILNASQQFIESPIIGSGLEENFFLFHPHNNIIEAFMATGILGGLSFLLLSYTAIKRSFIILKKQQEYGWIACLFLLVFFRGFFSSPLTNNTLWYLMMCVFAVPVSGNVFQILRGGK